ncbi:MAG: DNA double-strand break repair protein Mre11, partial [Cyanobacteriota bacterium]
KEDKGFVIVELERGGAKWDFCPLPVRTFCTIELDIANATDPHQALLKAIKKKDIKDAVVRLIYKLRSEQLDLIDNATLHEALSDAHSYTIRPELVSQLARPRLPELGIGNTINPIDALCAYLENRQDLKEISSEMMEAAQRLLAGHDQSWLDLAEPKTAQLGESEDKDSQRLKGNTDAQLRLL